MAVEEGEKKRHRLAHLTYTLVRIAAMNNERYTIAGSWYFD